MTNPKFSCHSRFEKLDAEKWYENDWIGLQDYPTWLEYHQKCLGINETQVSKLVVNNLIELEEKLWIFGMYGAYGRAF